jgi:hypothetical protein
MAPNKPLEILYHPINDAQKEVSKKWDKSKLLILEGVAGAGKAQPLDSIVMTPCGPKEMQYISVGEEVLTTTGITTVVGVFPQGVKPVFVVKFNDGTEVKCCGEHLWEVNVLDKDCKKVKSTEELRKGLFRSDGRALYSIDACEPAQFESSVIQVVDPYLLGFILAKGAVFDNTVILQIPSPHSLKKLRLCLPQGYKLTRSNSKSRQDFLLTHEEGKNIISEFLCSLGLSHKTVYERSIPRDYLYADIDQRKRLLQGLMDGDGGHRGKYPEYYTSSPALKDSVCTLVQSLGGLCYVSERQPYYLNENEKVVSQHTAYILRINIPFNPFTLPRKSERFVSRKRVGVKRHIVSILPAGFEECQCISLNGENKLYLTNGFTPTHNTSSALAHSLIDLQKNKIKKLMLCRPTVAVEEDLGHLPGDMNEKLMPWMGSFLDVLGDMSHAKDFQHMNVELVPIGMLRGRTVKNAVLVVDEAQNLSYAQLVCAVTRVGFNGKIVLCGDPTQSDLRYSPNPFKQISERLEIVEGCNVIRFTKEHQVREPFINDVLDALNSWE